MSEPHSAPRLLALVKPPKPLGEMNDAELDTFVNALFDQIAGDERPRQPSAQNLAGEDEAEIAPRTGRQRPQHFPQNAADEHDPTGPKRNKRTQRDAES